jgi:ion channel POLLUX/CASTOR
MARQGRESFRNRLSYGFDRTMAAGPIALIGWLTVVAFVGVAIAGLFIAVSGVRQEGETEAHSFMEASWEALMRTLDAGTMGGDTGWAFRIVMLIVTLWGIFVVATLIGLISTGVQAKIEDLRKGRSLVLETGHTVILNWSPSIFDILSELITAHSDTGGVPIVIMADMDKVEMEDEIAAKVKVPRGMRLVCRRGDPTDPHDLNIVNLMNAKSVIVLSPSGDDPDSHVTKTVMAIVHDPNRRKQPHQIAAEFREAINAETAQAVGGDELQIVLADDLISRIIVHTSRQSGLSGVYAELLDFEGCEIYVAAQRELVGKTYREALLSYEWAAVLGLCNPAGDIKLNPPSDTPIQEGSRLILVAENRKSIVLAKSKGVEIDAASMLAPTPMERHAERTLILDWNRRGPTVVSELARFVAPESYILVAGDTSNFEAEVKALTNLRRDIKIAYQICDTSRARVLESLDITSFEHVIVLGHGDGASAQAADTRTLVTLLHLRRIADAAGKHISVVSEMIDIRNRQLAEVTRADDFVVSNKLVSLMLAQASENEHLAAIFRELLDEQGAEIYMRPVEEYVPLEKAVNFYTIVEAARQRGETAFGHCRVRPGQDNARHLGGIELNPHKSQKVAYQAGDMIVVLAQ